MNHKSALPAIVFLVFLSACSQTDTRRAALESLVQAEMSFAATSVAKGIRDAFMAYLADSAIVFRPHPANGLAVFRERKDTPITLNWRPIYADISSAGDFGYTTGPWEIRDNSLEKRPPSHGNFFSVWQKNADGDWKVSVDLGVTNPEPEDLPQQWQSPSSGTVSAAEPYGAAELARERSALLQKDQAFSEVAAARGLVAAYQSYLAEEARLLRPGQFPITDKNAMYAKLAERQGASSWRPLRADIARSLDLAYTMGAYDFRPSGQSAIVQKGYYVRVWKKQADGDWKVVLDVENDLPQETSATGE
jgi:ketosteroid isomerase-like protein